MQKSRSLVVTKLDRYFILCSAFYYFDFSFIIIFLKSFFFSKNYLCFSLFSDVNNSDLDRIPYIIGSRVDPPRIRKCSVNESENIIKYVTLDQQRNSP